MRANFSFNIKKAKIWTPKIIRPDVKALTNATKVWPSEFRAAPLVGAMGTAVVGFAVADVKVVLALVRFVRTDEVKEAVLFREVDMFFARQSFV